MALKFYSDIIVPNISTTDIHAENVYAVNIGTEDESITNIHAENVYAVNIGTEDESITNIHAENIQATSIQATTIGDVGKGVQTIYANNIGTTDDVVDYIIARNVGMPSKPVGIYASSITKPDGWTYQDKDHTSLDVVIQEIDKRLDSLGFNSGGKISMKINNSTFIDVGYIYKLGDVFYGATAIIPCQNTNSRIESVTIKIQLSGITKDQVTALQIFPPQVMTTHISGRYGIQETRLYQNMSYTDYTFSYWNNFPQGTVAYDEPILSSCVILGTTNLDHALSFPQA